MYAMHIRVLVYYWPILSSLQTLFEDQIRIHSSLNRIGIQVSVTYAGLQYTDNIVCDGADLKLRNISLVTLQLPFVLSVHLASQDKKLCVN